MAGSGVTIHVVGSMMIDRVVRVQSLPRAGETVAARSASVFAGGKGANQAAAAAKCGARVRMLGRGADDARFIVDALREAGVRTGSISLDDEASGNATVMVANGGQNAIIIAPEANLRIARAAIERFFDDGQQGDLALFQNECSHLEAGIAAAAARGLRVWLNAAPADHALRDLRFTKLAGLVVNETEAEILTGEAEPPRALEALAARMPGGTVVVTLGESGAIAAVGGARYAHRGFAVDAVDTVGCGDAFVGAYLAAIAEGMDVVRALARGNAAGALAAMREGAMASLPSRAEVDVAALLPEGTRLKPRPAAVGGKPPRCEVCDYDIVEQSIGDACPECGTTIAPARFAGRWRVPRGRRRFRLASWIFLVGAALHAAAAGMIITELWRLGSLAPMVYIVALVSSLVFVAFGMVGLSVSSADTSRRRRIAIGAAAMRLLVPALIPIAAAAGWPSLAWIEGTVIAITLADGAFAWSIADLTRGTFVRRVPRLRHHGLALLAALSVAIACATDIASPPKLLFASTTAVLAWTALEIRGIARRMRALEPA